jgi:hypothetical protein
VAWADLLQGVFEVDALRRVDCGATMRRIEAITDQNGAGRILACLSLPPRAPPLGSARKPDCEREMGRGNRDRNSAEMDGDPGFDSDQSVRDA